MVRALLVVLCAALAGAAPCVDHPLAAGGRVARVVRAVDGDTVVVALDPPLPAPLGDLHVRIAGVDCPETHAPRCAAERAAGAAATRFTEAWIARATAVRLCGWDKYGGRADGDVAAGDAGWLGAALLAAGHARPFDGRGARAGWCAEPAAASCPAVGAAPPP